jgi:hypothetical protein
MEAIRKAAPELLLVGPGMPGAEAWIPAAMQRVNSSVFLWCPEMFRVLSSGRKRRSGSPRPGSPGTRNPAPALPARMAGFLASLWISGFKQ